jgi:hypothetical protein
VTAKVHAVAGQELPGGDAGDRADGPAGGGDGRRVAGVRPASQDQEAVGRHQQGHEHHGPDAGHGGDGETAGGERHPALEADGGAQVAREELRDGRGNVQIGPDRRGEQAEEEQDSGVDQVLNQ